MTPLNKWKEVVGFARIEFAPDKDWDGNKFPVLAHALQLNWDVHPTLLAMLVNIRYRIRNKYPKARVYITPNGGFAYSGHSSRSLHKGKKNDYLDFKLPTGECFFNGKLARAADITVVLGQHTSVNMAHIVVEFIQPYIDKDWGLGLYLHNNFVHIDWRKGVEDRTDAVWYRDEKGKYHFYRFPELARMLENATSAHAEVAQADEDAALLDVSNATPSMQVKDKASNKDPQTETDTDEQTSPQDEVT